MTQGSTPLKNARHELVAQGIAEGKTADQAYENAGYKAHRQNAARLMTNDDIQTRVAFLQGQAAERTITTIETITAELEDTRKLAEGAKNPSAMVSAIMGKARVNGLLNDRHPLGMKEIKDMNKSELLFLLGRASAA